VKVRTLSSTAAYRLQAAAERAQRHAAQAELHQVHAQRAQADLRALAAAAGLEDGQGVAIDGEPNGLPTGTVYDLRTGQPVMVAEPAEKEKSDD
jgi:hypothetical protein